MTIGTITASEQCIRKLRLKSLRRKEYQRLRTMVPCIAANPNASKVTVVEEAVKYIEQLHEALMEKLKSSGNLPVALERGEDTSARRSTSDGDRSKILSADAFRAICRQLQDYKHLGLSNRNSRPPGKPDRMERLFDEFNRREMLSDNLMRPSVNSNSHPRRPVDLNIYRGRIPHLKMDRGPRSVAPN